MPQANFNILPKYINTDAPFDSLSGDETPFAAGIEITINQNPDLGIGLNNPTESGQNTINLTPSRSNIAVDNVILPAGINKEIGTFESKLTNELYYLNKNSNGNDGVYVIEGDTGLWKKVLVDPELGFTDNQEAYMKDHRVALRIIYDKDKNIIEKILTITDGNSWQKWILVNAATLTNGFDTSLFPYWVTRQPHFDRRELFEWATRPPMINPIVTPIPNSVGDVGLVNSLIDQAFQFTSRNGNTDGRITALGSYSEPLIIKSEDFLNNPNTLPKRSLIKLDGGSPMTEFKDIFVRKSSKKTQGVASTATWGDWLWVERIYRFGNDPNVLSTPYWLRTDEWANYNYNTEFNTIEYIFDNRRLALIIDQAEANNIQNDIPQKSQAQGVLNDTAALANNLYDYDNAPQTLVDKLAIRVQSTPVFTCTKPLRKLTFYAYVGMRTSDGTYISQVGYVNGSTDPLIRFGGLRQASFIQNKARIDVNESNFFDLNFAGKPGFRLYLKGTPYFADAEWIIVNADNSRTEIQNVYDLSSDDVLELVQQVFEAGGYFAARFTLFVPSDRYIATIGRHNVASTGNYRDTSTYIYGIANSRVKSSTNFLSSNGIYQLTTIKPNAINNNNGILYSKEMEVDCTAGDVDVWGNNADLFYIYCPYLPGGSFRFIEGYIDESAGSPVPVEMFPYHLTNPAFVGTDWGKFTDKNGFYWGFSTFLASDADIEFSAKVNCAFPTTFVIPTSEAGSGWKKNNIAYLSDNNGGVFGDCNRILLTGRMTNLDGTIGYSNVAISIKDGMTVYTDTNGGFTLIIHNGQSFTRSSNIYINAGSNFRITIADCGQVPLFNFDETLVPCVNCQPRTYPLPLNLALNAEGGSITSLKENASYSVGFACADLAGRLMYVNVIDNVQVPSYLQTGSVVSYFFQMAISAALQFQLVNPDMKWFAPYVSPQLNTLKYFQWVGDKLTYIDSNGQVVTDPATAAFVSIFIDSLYNYNVGNNLSLLANWQFTPEDRIRILDNGEGVLFDVATYGDPIDLQVLGSTYNQAAQVAGLLPNPQNPIVNVSTAQTDLATSITLFVRYDKRLDKLFNKTGFWIELYTPFQQTEQVPYSELKWYPLVNGEIAEFTGSPGGVPVFNYPTTINFTYWDTYLFSRNISIPDVGSKWFNHVFASPNVSDSFGANLTSGGRKHVRNDNAKQIWKINNVIKSDVYITTGIINGLGTFKRDKQHETDFSNNNYNGIIAMISLQGNVILFICPNDYFTTNYDFHYSYPNEQGVMVVNLDSGLSRPFQKIGNNFGVAPDDTGTVIVVDEYVFWYDRKNESMIMCDYKAARDISDIEDKEGKKYGIKSYLIEKTKFISDWNQSHNNNSRFDVIAGVDITSNQVYFTFRPRRINSNDPTSYVNQRRNISIAHQETICYDYDTGRWIPNARFTPEGYGNLKGLKTGVQMITFAAGKPYYHSSARNSFLNYYGVQTEPVLMAVFNNEKELVKIFQNMTQDILPDALYIDMVYDNELNSFSYLPANLIVKKENVFYGALLRDMASYLSTDPAESFRSTLVDGKRIFSRYCVVRFVGQLDKLNQYFQLSNISYGAIKSPTNSK